MPTPRTHDERLAAARLRLQQEFQMWLSTCGRRRPHLIPVAFVGDNDAIVTATGASSKTVRNLRETGWARMAVGTTSDVVMVDTVLDGLVPVPEVDTDVADRYAAVSHDPRKMPGYLYIRLLPRRIQVWNGFHEFPGRTVMRKGEWLSDPVD
ncbi:pyridoxamine 5'-phosphate oxidase family protein [Streptomyces sp. NBC_00445]|uniref:pyridoxamine 5'-phosphate oxidase family protein n=1 Tax=unclassified Streptomyces TaxID=2593676 RepID=UPI002E1AFACC|nr:MULTISPECIES: pyridoxamine 5'-phosphate oxidase family protein [unclassified Streptomyces]